MNREGAHDVSDVYSPLRITAMAKKVGLDPGWGLDFTVADDDGLAWDFSTDRDTYLHRVGRAGRFGTKGLAINLVKPD